MAKISTLRGKPINECTADELTTAAAAARKRSSDSFDRCDTDGFLSQWANDISASLYERQAKLAAAGGVAPFPALFFGDQEVTRRAVTFPNSFAGGMVRKWHLPPEWAARFGRRWIPCGDRSRIQANLGLHEQDVPRAAVAIITTGGRQDTGLAGCANAFVAVVPLEEADDF